MTDEQHQDDDDAPRTARSSAGRKRTKSRSRTEGGARRDAGERAERQTRSTGAGLDAAAFLADGMVAPEELMGNFSENRMGRGMTISAILHVVVIGLFSLGFLYAMVGGHTDTLTDEERAQQAEAELQKSLRDIARKHGIPAQDLLRQVAPPLPPAPAPTTQAPGREELMQDTKPTTEENASEERDLTPVEKRITDTAAPDEIPDRPDSMDDLLEGM